MRGYNLTSERLALEALQNAFILIYRCEIYPYYVYTLFIIHVFVNFNATLIA